VAVAAAPTLNNSAAWWRVLPSAAAGGKAGLKCNLGLMLFRTCVRCPLPGGGYIYRKKVEAKKEEEEKKVGHKL
jgi:hypothetical protein